jgi:hypothetical protein
VQPRIDVPTGGTLVARGWAVDDAAHLPGKAVIVRVDGAAPIIGRYGIDRPDVAKALDAPALAKSGFEASIPTAGLSVGQHELSFEIENAAGSGKYRVPKRIEFVIT